MSDLAVGIDTSPLALTRAGTARYVTSLMNALDDEEGLRLRPYRFGGDSRLAKVARDTAWYLALLPARAHRDGVEVLHCPSFRGPVRSSVPVVVSCHDLAILRHPDAFNAWSRNYARVLLPHVLRAAARVIAVSEFTRDELVELLGVPTEKIRVIPNGVAPRFRAEGPAAAGDYVLAVSTIEPRKNLPRLVEGFRRAALDGCELLVVGAQGWGGVRIQDERVRTLGEVNDEDLARLYRGARCVAYVSLYEGFGLPIVEAMACGAPVVTTGWGSCAEVAGDAAVLVDALDTEAIAAGLVEAVERGEELRRAGLARAAAFDWRQTARTTMDVYREAAA